MLIKIIKFTQAFGTPLNTPSHIDFQWLNIWETLRQKLNESNLPISPLQRQSINAQLARFLCIAPSQRSESTTLLFLFACSERSALDLTTFLTLLTPAEELRYKEQDIKQKRQQMRALMHLLRQAQGIQPTLKNPQEEQQNIEAQQLLYLISQTQIGLGNIIESLKDDFSGGAIQDDQILLASNFKRFMDVDTSMPTC